MASKNPKSSGAPGKRRLSVQFYEKLLDAYRDRPGNHSAAARHVGCTRKTARRAWHDGWETYPWAKAIKLIIHEEKEVARARIQRLVDADLENPPDPNLQRGAGGSLVEEFNDPTPLDEKAEGRRQAHLAFMTERQKARENAVKSREEEGQLVQGARKAVMQSVASLLRLTGGIQLLADRCNKELQKIAENPDKFDLSGSLASIRKFAWAIRDANSAAQTAMEMERLLLGEPTEILGVQVANFDGASVEEMQAEVLKAAKAIERAGLRSQQLVAKAGAEPKEAVGDGNGKIDPTVH